MRERHVMWAVAMGVILSFVQQWSGCNAVNGYAQTILSNAGFSATDSKKQAIYIGIVKIAFVLVALVLMDRAGRRNLLLWGTAGMAASLSLFAGLQVVIARGSPPRYISYLSAAALFAYMGSFEISLGPILWVLLSELYPTSVRGRAMAIGSTSCWAFTAAVTMSYPVLQDAMGEYVFIIFAVVTGLGWVWMWAYIPETKGRTLEEIEAMLKGRRKHSVDVEEDAGDDRSRPWL